MNRLLFILSLILTAVFVADISTQLLNLYMDWKLKQLKKKQRRILRGDSN